MADKDGTGRSKKKKTKRQTIRVPSDEVPRRPGSSPSVGAVKEDDGFDPAIDESIEVRLTPVPDPPLADPPSQSAARLKTVVDMHLPSGLLEMFGEPDERGPSHPPRPAAEEPAEVAVDVDVVEAMTPAPLPARLAAPVEPPPQVPPPVPPQVPPPVPPPAPPPVPPRSLPVGAVPLPVPWASPTAAPGHRPPPAPPPAVAPVPAATPRPRAPIATPAPRAPAPNASLPQAVRRDAAATAVVLMAPIRSVGDPVPSEPVVTPPAIEEPAELRMMDAAPPPVALRPSRAPTQSGMGGPTDGRDLDDGWSGVSASDAAIAALVREGIDDDDRPLPGDSTDPGEQSEDLAAEPTQVRRISTPAPAEPDVDPSIAPARDSTIEIAVVEPVPDERDSDPPTPIEVDEEIAAVSPPPPVLLRATEPSAVPPVPAPALAPTPPPPPMPVVLPSPVSLPPPPPVPLPETRKKKSKKWWEDFFGDDYLRTVPRISEEFNARECDFIEASLGVERGASLLDLGCGAGRQSVNLCERGYSIVGLDLSLAMLTRAQALADERGQKINFMQADMKEMTFEAAFDGILCMGTTFGLFDDEGNVGVIKNMHRALKENGALLVEVANRDFVVRGQPNLIWFEGDGCVCMEETTVNFITSRLHVKRTVILDDGDKLESEYSVRLFSLHELGSMLHKNGFRVTEVSGHFATRGAFFGVDSPRLIILAEKREAEITGAGPSSVELP